MEPELTATASSSWQNLVQLEHAWTHGPEPYREHRDAAEHAHATENVR